MSTEQELTTRTTVEKELREWSETVMDKVVSNGGSKDSKVVFSMSMLGSELPSGDGAVVSVMVNSGLADDQDPEESLRTTVDIMAMALSRSPELKSLIELAMMRIKIADKGIQKLPFGPEPHND